MRWCPSPVQVRQGHSLRFDSAVMVGQLLLYSYVVSANVGEGRGEWLRVESSVRRIS